jgi:hypothetical protein
MEELFLEILERNLDSEMCVSVYLDSTNSWVRGLKILSIANEVLRYTYYEVNPKDKNAPRKLVERITPLEFVLDVKLEQRGNKDYKDLKKDYDLDFIPEYEIDDWGDDDSLELI